MTNTQPEMIAVVMAGGRGTRFWPRSRGHRPKQFLAMVGSETLLHQTVARLKPRFPEAMTGVGIRGITYAGTVLDLTFTPTKITIASRASSGRPLYYFLEEIAAGSSHEFEYEEGTEVLLTLEARPESVVEEWQRYR